MRDFYETLCAVIEHNSYVDTLETLANIAEDEDNATNPEIGEILRNAAKAIEDLCA